MKNKFKAIVGSVLTVLSLYLFTVDYKITVDSIVHPLFFNAVAFIIGFAFLIVALDGLIKWDREDEGGLL